MEQFQQQGILMALSELSLSYKAPLRAGDTFYVTTAIAQVGGNVTFENFQRGVMAAWL